MKRLLLFCLIIFMTVSLIACGNRMEEYTSHSGPNRIKAEYDHVSRPSVCYNCDSVWEYKGSGFNEEVFFKVEWIDDDTIKLIYNDESHNGKYYEEYEIDL